MEHNGRQTRGVGSGKTFVCARAEGAGQTGGRTQASGRGGDAPRAFVANVRSPGGSCAVAGAPFGPWQIPKTPLNRRSRLDGPVVPPFGGLSGTRLRCFNPEAKKIGCVRRAVEEGRLWSGRLASRRSGVLPHGTEGEGESGAGDWEARSRSASG